jgi:hypothetical protein
VNTDLQQGGTVHQQGKNDLYKLWKFTWKNKTTPRPVFYTIHKVSFRWSIDFNVNGKTIKLNNILSEDKQRFLK